MKSNLPAQPYLNYQYLGVAAFFKKRIGKKEASDSGMAVVLILLLIGLFSGNNLYYKFAIPALVVNMIYPMFYKYFAIFWFALSQLIGTVVSRIILTVVYVILVVPVGLIRRLIGKDSLQLRNYKKSSESVMKTRDYHFTSKDILHPY
jgi:hypothetical protein